MATTKQTYEIIKVLSELSKQGPFSMEQGLGSLKDVIKINSPFASKKAKEIWKNSDKNLELLFTVSGSSTKGYTTTDVQKLLGLKVEEKKKAPSIKPFVSKKAKALADEINNYPPGTVTHIYTTSDGGFHLNQLNELNTYLEEHVSVVNPNELVKRVYEKESLVV